ncbi:hypothetical protein D3C71_1875100 [compost metagenome]
MDLLVFIVSQEEKQIHQGRRGVCYLQDGRQFDHSGLSGGGAIVYVGLNWLGELSIVDSEMIGKSGSRGRKRGPRNNGRGFVCVLSFQVLTT